ncbi:hypothetical protein PVAND_012541 [Polypedilum vanderplanki]|uniref:Uncharacterized protein n=1 Tax=Polypedilum vanderplanki TaxID=319348 RepID=A0A9J6CLY5_POLVA|nr:hypothetical protein PVAND_012541 [Polypedilum vanderplanki]
MLFSNSQVFLAISTSILTTIYPKSLKNSKLTKMERANPEIDETDKLFMLNIHTNFFKKYLMMHFANTNKVTKSFVETLRDVADLISRISDSAELVEENDKIIERDQDINSIFKPAVHNHTLQLRSFFYCNVCKHDVNPIAEMLIQHFMSDRHIECLRYYANQDNSFVINHLNVNHARNNAARHQSLSSENEGSTQSLDENDAVNRAKNIVDKQAIQKQRLNSLPARIKDVIPKGRLPKGMTQFLLSTNLEKYTNQLMIIGQKNVDQKKYVKVCELLQQRLAFKYPKVKCYPFGSFAIGLGHERSDLDIFVDLDNCFYQKLPKRKMKDAIFNIQRILSMGNEWADFSPVTKARTPILRVFCRVQNVDCDLSFSNGLSYCNTKLIAYLINIQPICKKLIIFVKNWAAMLKFGVNSYMWTLMVIFYLQQEHALPPIIALQNATQPVYIEEWNVAFATPSIKHLNMPHLTNFKQYLAGFFKFYGYNFDFTNYMICILTGTRIPKHIFNHGKENTLPPVFQAYVKYMNNIDLDEADEINDLFANYKPLVVQDPFELIHNVSKGVQDQKLLKIIHYMRATLDIMTNAQQQH